jgi:FkbM family methyltransferase
MLLDYFEIKEKYNMNITGVIHVGGNHGEELKSYLEDDQLKHIVFFEVDPDNFKILKEKTDQLITDKEVHAIQKGLGPFSCEMTLYKETENKGQSNSVLKPKIHTQQYPGIVFHSETKIKIDPLDRYECSPVFNFLNIDVQGFELEVLRGAKKTLSNINWILCEVNRAEVYENCPYVEEIDDFLSKFNFKRVETNWAGQTWGDALYVKG